MTTELTKTQEKKMLKEYTSEDLMKKVKLNLGFISKI